MTRSAVPASGGPSTSATAGRGGAAALRAALADGVTLLVFATIGRASHEHGLSASGVAQTAAPFLLGAALGWAACLVMRRRPPISVGDGSVVWAGALVGGMLVRSAVGQGTAPSFIVVAGLVTGAVLLGWRIAAAAMRRRAAGPGARAGAAAGDHLAR